MPRRDHSDDDSLPVMVPRNDKPLVAVSPERVRRLREHLIKELAYLKTRKNLDRFADPKPMIGHGCYPDWSRASSSLTMGFDSHAANPSRTVFTGDVRHRPARDPR